jgi:hypothetical protein
MPRVGSFQKSPGESFGLWFVFVLIFGASIDTTFSIRRIGQNGVEGTQSNSVELDIDGDELPGLIGVDDDDDLTLKLRADEVIVKAKL